MDITWIWQFITYLTEAWFQTVFVAWIFYLWFRWANKKLFSEENIQKIRTINNKIDEEENVRSQLKIKNLQLYLEDNFEEFKSLWFDRVNVWHNHNGTRKWLFHFQYYSLISEVVANWLELFSQHGINTQKLNYYMFSEYEKRAIWDMPHLAQVSDLGNTAQTIANDLWTKSIYTRAICNLNWSVDAIIFFSSVYKTLTKEPDVEKHIQNIRIIFNK